MKKISTYFILILICFVSCKNKKSTGVTNLRFPSFDIEAHRGGRGLMPENTIPAMLNALKLGVNTLEMDIHVTKDGVVVVTHDDELSGDFTLQPNGKEISKEDKKKYVVYQMNYADLKKFDTGTKYYANFPQQQKVKAYIPRLAELIDSVQNYLTQNNIKQVFYNIETKCSEKGDNILHPDPETFVDLLVAVIKEKGITPFVVIQSFDKRTLQILHRKYPKISISYLIGNKNTFEKNIQELGFSPFILSPEYKLVDEMLVRKCHDNNIKIIPWTANTLEVIQKLKSLKVDGIITDYPNLLLSP